MDNKKNKDVEKTFLDVKIRHQTHFFGNFIVILRNAHRSKVSDYKPYNRPRLWFDVEHK